MTLPIYSETVLTALVPAGPSLTFNTDPKIEQEWEPRKFVEACLEGGTLTQDNGLYAIDCYRTLTWAGAGQWLDLATIQQLKAWLAVAGSTYRYQDVEGNDWTVELLQVKESMEFVDRYQCTVRVHVLAMADLLGNPYAGN